YYMFNAYRTLEIKSRLSAVERNWTKIEPEVTAADKRVAELEGIIKTTSTLDNYIENRFFWAPFLQKGPPCVPPHAPLNSLDASVLDDNKGISVSLDGVAAGREPRSVAEDLRQMLIEQLGHGYSGVKVEFKTLEDLDTIVNVGGTNMPMAHYLLAINLKSGP